MIEEKKLRIVAYITGEMREKVLKEAKKLGMNESTFVRFVLIQYLGK